MKRTALLIIFALSWLSSAAGWTIMELNGLSGPALRGVFGLNIVFHPCMFAAVWFRLLPARVVDVICVAFAAIVCAGCLVLRLYFPALGGNLDLQALYLWIPVIYVFAFTLMGHRASLKLSLAILIVFVAITLPHLVSGRDLPLTNFTVQLHMVSSLLIVALYFFSSYQHKFQLAQLTADELARLANSDELTKLANRRRMTEVIEAELARFARYGHEFALILIDVDHFKAVNDRLGHAVGDEVLVALGQRLGEQLRDVDMLGRWGGEEFLVVLPETGFDNALKKATALCAHVAAGPLAGQAVTISCGLSKLGKGDTLDALLRRADAALYVAKNGGRNRAEGLTGQA
ncbi:MAG: GGDEF domain-containing protein [Deltaproteobacteria bacterium]|nr:GGDEF domain-containing protein [Deltaproteobacteria bacterium]